MSGPLRSTVAAFGALSFVFLTTAKADVPRLINYQGKLSDGSGNCYSGTVGLRLRFYDAATNGNTLPFDETQSAVSVNQGLFGVLIGLCHKRGKPSFKQMLI